MFKALLNNQGVEINKASYAIDEEITKQLVRDDKGVALLRCEEACELEKAGQASIWEQGDRKSILWFGLSSEGIA